MCIKDLRDCATHSLITTWTNISHNLQQRMEKQHNDKKKASFQRFRSCV